MKKILLRFCLFLCFGLSCNHVSSATFAQRLEQIFLDYQALEKPKDIQRLVELDAALKRLENDVHEKGVSPIFFKKKHTLIGVEGDHQSDQMVYSGKLLTEAHKINPNSDYRAHTLFSTVENKSKYGFGDMPNLKQAKQYLQEFPEGVFAGETNSILGSFYDDKAKVLRNLSNSKYEKDYKYDCFKEFLSKDSYQTQLLKTRRLAISHLEKAILQTTEMGKKKRLRQELLDVKNGTSNGWYWCGD